jgi:MFS family permease
MLSGIIGGVLSSAISSSLHDRLGYEGWRWIFLIEGGVTIVWGVVLLFLLSDYPDTTSFLSSEEKKAVQASIGKRSAAAAIDRGAIISILKRPSTYVFMVRTNHCFLY